MKTGVERITEERQRQVDEEDFDAAHDAGHTDYSLALAAVCYAAPEKLYHKREHTDGFYYRDPWPPGWDVDWDKRRAYGSCKEEPGYYLPDPDTYTHAERVELLTKAGALIAAEIDRLQRARENDKARNGEKE